MLELPVLIRSFLALGLVLVTAAAARAASECPNQITACGCVIAAAGTYEVTAALTQSTVGATCLAVDAAGVRLNLGGNSMTGASSAPSTAETIDLGLHLTRKATNAIVIGGGATISNFATSGIEVDGNGAIISGVNTDRNEEEGIVLDGARGTQLIGVDASNNTSVGIFLDRASGNSLSDVTANNNGAVGIYLFDVSSSNRVADFEANSNGGEGVEVAPFSCPKFATGPACHRPGGRGNTIIGGEANGNTLYGISLETRTMSTVSGNSAATNGQDDLRDAATNCADNIWFANTFTSATP
jgi:parallel beta-helix repeat protein